MPNMRSLAAGLEAYRDTSERHIHLVQAEFDEVSRAWLSLGECFEGTAADEFRPIWEGVSARFREYVERSTELVRTLAHRIDDLRAADRPTDLPM